MPKEKPLNKYELVSLADTLGYPLLLGLTSVHPDRLFWHIFRMKPRNNLLKNQLPWTEIETKRLRFLQSVIKELKGSYNPEGIRQWFRRPRTQLDNKKPGELLYRTDWNPDDPKIQKLLELARSLTGGGAT